MDPINETNSLRRPGTFWQLTYHSNSEDMRHMAGHSYSDKETGSEYPSESQMSFYLISSKLRQGEPFDGRFPEDLRLWIADAAGPIADHLGNPLSWTIMSDRLVDHLWPMISDCVRVFPAPLYLKDTDNKIPGYQVVNVTKVFDCVDRDHSIPWFDHYGELGGYSELCIDGSLTGGANIFKYRVSPDFVNTGVICSFELVNSLSHKGFTGLAFLPCVCREEK